MGLNWYSKRIKKCDAIKRIQQTCNKAVESHTGNLKLNKYNQNEFNLSQVFRHEEKYKILNYCIKNISLWMEWQWKLFLLLRVIVINQYLLNFTVQ